MNVFAIDSDPKTAARHLVDRHCVKMALESAQILSNCFEESFLMSPDCPKTKTGNARKHSYPHHPCCKWIKESKNNMIWLIEHAIELDRERIARFNSAAPHFSLPFIEWCGKNIKKSLVPDGNLTPFAQAMPEEYKNNDPILAYRSYYKHGKVHLHKWKRNRPDWI